MSGYPFSNIQTEVWRIVRDAIIPSVFIAALWQEPGVLSSHHVVLAT